MVFVFMRVRFTRVQLYAVIVLVVACKRKCLTMAFHFLLLSDFRTEQTGICQVLEKFQ